MSAAPLGRDRIDPSKPDSNHQDDYRKCALAINGLVEVITVAIGELADCARCWPRKPPCDDPREEGEATDATGG